MPFNAARSSTVRLRPPLGDGVNAGINGSKAAHNSLLIFRLVMPPRIRRAWINVQVVLAALIRTPPHTYIVISHNTPFVRYL
jgi:hypothetical protein